MDHWIIPKNPFVCPKEGIIPKILLFSDGIGTRKILFDREGSGFLGNDLDDLVVVNNAPRLVFLSISNHYHIPEN